MIKTIRNKKITSKLLSKFQIQMNLAVIYRALKDFLKHLNFKAKIALLQAVYRSRKLCLTDNKYSKNKNQQETLTKQCSQ